MLDNRSMLHVTRLISHRRRQKRCLDDLVRLSGWSKFYLQRRFTRLLGESPGRFQQRLQLELAATLVVTTETPLLEIALASGFSSHAAFTRAFNRHFTCTPSQYRSRALPDISPQQRERHAELVKNIGPCLGLYRMSLETKKEKYYAIVGNHP